MSGWDAILVAAAAGAWLAVRRRAEAFVAIGVLVVVGFAFYFWNRPAPRLVGNYWLIYCAITVASAIAMWYVPYLFGTSEKQKRDYSAMYAGTRQVLPARGDNPRPNLLHIFFHILFALNFFLALALRFDRG